MIESFLTTIAKFKEQMQNDVPFNNLAMDLPDDRDWVAGVPTLRHFPTRIDLVKKAQNLGFTPRKQSKGSCTAYSEIFRAEIENTIEHGKKIILDTEAQWAWQEKSGASREKGDWIQNAKKQFQKHPQGFPQTEYRRIDGGVDLCKKWLAKQKPINTGIYWRWLSDKRMTNFRYMKETGIYIPGEGKVLGGHAIILTGFDRGVIKFLEPELTRNKSGNNQDGVFEIFEDHFEKLMSQYISFDAWDK